MNLTRRDFLKLAGLIAGSTALASCSTEQDEQPIETEIPSINEDESNRLKEEILSEFLTEEEKFEYKRQVVEEILSTSLSQSLGDASEDNRGNGIDQVTRVNQMRLGWQILLTSLASKAYIETIWNDAIKYQKADPTLLATLADLTTSSTGRIVPVEGSSVIISSSQLRLSAYIINAREVDRPGRTVWYKLYRAPRNGSQDFADMASAQRTWLEHATSYGYSQTPEEEIVLGKVILKKAGNQSDVPYFVLRTPNVGDIAAEGWLIRHPEQAPQVKQLFLDWFNRTVDKISKGEYAFVHKDPHGNNLRIEFDADGKPAQLVPIDFDFPNAVFENPEVAAKFQAQKLLEKLQRIAEIPEMNGNGLGITEDELLLILRQYFPEITDIKTANRSVVIKAPNQPDRVVSFHISEATNNSIRGRGEAIKGPLIESLSQGDIPEIIELDLQRRDGSPMKLILNSAGNTLNIPDVPEIRQMNSLELAVAKYGPRALTIGKGLLKALEISGYLLTIYDIWSEGQQPNFINEEVGGDSVQNVMRFDHRVMIDSIKNFISTGIVDKLFQRLDRMDNVRTVNQGVTTSPWVVNSDEETINKEGIITEQGQVRVHPQMHTTLEPFNDDPLLYRFQNEALALRLIELVTGLPLSNSALRPLAKADQYNFNATIPAMNARRILADEINRTGFWHMVNLSTGLDPIFGVSSFGSVPATIIDDGVSDIQLVIGTIVDEKVESAVTLYYDRKDYISGNRLQLKDIFVHRKELVPFGDGFTLDLTQEEDILIEYMRNKLFVKKSQ